MTEQKYEFPESELEASLKKVFVGHTADSIIMDGHEMRSRFKRDVINYGIEKGWLCEGRDINEEQYFAYTYRLTDKGKEYFLNPVVN